MYKEGVYKQRERSKPKEKPAENKPTINQNVKGVKRVGNICDSLYSDAQRRQNLNRVKVLCFSQAPEQSVSSIMSSKPSARTNSRLKIKHITKLNQLNQGN